MLENNRIDYWGFVGLAYVVKACPNLQSVYIGNFILNIANNDFSS